MPLKDKDGSKYAAISDFGIGRFIDRDTSTITGSRVAIGTIAYAAPEQLKDTKNADKRADIYAIGKILYELLTSEPPFPSLDYNKIPSKYVYIISMCCDNDPNRRYQNVKELIQDIDNLIKNELPLTRPAELIKQEVNRILEELEFKPERTKKIMRLLLENTDDQEVILRVFPSLMLGLLRKIIIEYPGEFNSLIEIYDANVSGDLSFEYCDSVADFYEKIFNITTDMRTKIIILKRLPSLGSKHNRWHVGEVFASLVGKIEDPALNAEVAKILKSDRSAAKWCAEYLKKYSIPKLISDLL